MSDQALAWKAGFGALVLLFSAATYVTRKAPEQPATAVPAVAPALPPALQASEPAPLDVQDDPPPVRVQVTLHEPEPPAMTHPPARAGVPPPVRAEVLPPARSQRTAKASVARVHHVVARRKASPYAIGRKHYPLDPRQRWALRDAP